MRHGLAALLGVVQRSIRTHAMLGAGERVLVAVSGGADSTGLLLALAQLRRKLDLELVAAHVNHRLRDEADADEACAADAAARLQVPFVRTELPGLGGGANLEARARTQRYAALHRLATAAGCTRIATGHTLDDQAETVLMRLIRGSSGRGLTAVRPRRADGVIRPLLDCRRAAVAAAVKAAGLPFRFDHSNADPRFLRTHVRQRVLPLLAELNPSIAAACARLAAAAGAERAVVVAWADAQLASAASDLHIDADRLRAVPPGLRPLLARRWLVHGGVRASGLTARHADAVVELAARRGVGRETHLPGGWTVRRTATALVLEPPGGVARRPRRGAEKLF